MRASRLIASLTLVLAGCASVSDKAGGPQTESMSADQLVQTDFNRVVTVAMRDNLASLDRLAGKLYRRNPREWRKAGWPNDEAARADLRQAIEQQRPPAGMRDLHDVRLLAAAFNADYQGDRVAALVYGMADTMVAAHDGKTRFYVTSSLDAQRIYNAARNIEIAAWLLNSRKAPDGQPLLYANEMSTEHSNLSFEREFGALIARLDLVANLLGENIRRIGINYAQTLLFLNFLPVR